LFVFGKLFSGSAAEAISICRRRKRTFREETANPLNFGAFQNQTMPAKQN
jgi:hypothetical protein